MGQRHTLADLVLALVSVLVAMNWVMLARTRGLLPRPDDDQVPGDWLDDARLLVDRVAAQAAAADQSVRCLARPHRRHRVDPAPGNPGCRGGEPRRRPGGRDRCLRENGFGTLFFSETAWFSGGAYAFGMIANAVLRNWPARQPRGRLRQALHSAAIAGAAALPVSLGLRGSILVATGLNSIRSTPASITVLTFVGALLTGTVVFAGMMMTRPSRR